MPSSSSRAARIAHVAVTTVAHPAAAVAPDCIEFAVIPAVHNIVMPYALTRVPALRADAEYGTTGAGSEVKGGGGSSAGKSDGMDQMVAEGKAVGGGDDVGELQRWRLLHGMLYWAHSNPVPSAPLPPPPPLPPPQPTRLH